VVELELPYAFEGTSLKGPVPVHVFVAFGMAAALTWRRTHPLLVAPAVQYGPAHRQKIRRSPR